MFQTIRRETRAEASSARRRRLWQQRVIAQHCRNLSSTESALTFLGQVPLMATLMSPTARLALQRVCQEGRGIGQPPHPPGADGTDVTCYLPHSVIRGERSKGSEGGVMFNTQKQEQMLTHTHMCMLKSFLYKGV